MLAAVPNVTAGRSRSKAIHLPRSLMTPAPTPTIRSVGPISPATADLVTSSQMGVARASPWRGVPPARTRASCPRVSSFFPSSSSSSLACECPCESGTSTSCTVHPPERRASATAAPAAWRVRVSNRTARACPPRTSRRSRASARPHHPRRRLRADRSCVSCRTRSEWSFRRAWLFPSFAHPMLEFPAPLQHVLQVVADLVDLLLVQLQDVAQGLADGRDVLLDVASAS